MTLVYVWSRFEKKNVVPFPILNTLFLYTVVYFKIISVFLIVFCKCTVSIHLSSEFSGFHFRSWYFSKCSQLAAFETIYKKYISNMEEKVKEEPCCPLCHRNFDTLKEMQNLVEEVGGRFLDSFSIWGVFWFKFS